MVINKLDAIQYWDIVDLIEFKDEAEKWIRIGYYRQSKGRLIFAGQTTITEPISMRKSILLNAAKEKEWFRDLLEEVVNDLVERTRQ